jgi:uncharacterized protein (TIGR00251 family)
VSKGVTFNVLLKITKNEESITFNVRVTPRSSKTEFVGMHDGALKIKLKSPPVDGAANEELIRLLSKAFNVPRSNLTIVSGQSSRTKRIQMIGATEQDIDRFLQGKT